MFIGLSGKTNNKLRSEERNLMMSDKLQFVVDSRKKSFLEHHRQTEVCRTSLNECR